jgi:hypothetical protein
MFINNKKTVCIRCSNYRKAYYRTIIGDYETWTSKTKLCEICFNRLSKTHGSNTIEQAIIEAENEILLNFDAKLTE